MKQWIYIARIIGIVTLISIVISIIKQELSFLSFINYLFLTTLPLLIVSLAMFVLEGGFFTVMGYSFRKYHASLKKKGYEEEVADKVIIMRPPPKYKMTKPFLYSSFLVIIFTIIFGFLIS